MSAGARGGSWAVVVALALLWSVGLFGRVYWTPDEPREAALATSVSAHPAALPSLAGVSFAEKPPLTYWLAGASLRFLGPTPAAARVPQLCYALLGFISVVALARRLLGAAGAAGAARVAALAAGLQFVSGELVYQVQIWLDTDALLLAGVCVALAGMYAGLSVSAQVAANAAAARHARLRGFLAMHVGLMLAFFGKNFAAWLVPVLAFLCFIAWERRWHELRRWEFYIGGLLPVACILLWIRAVAAEPDGTHALRILFWNNLVGRAMPVAAEAQFNYATGHPNWPGKYFVELGVDLLPWTALALAALIAAGRGASVPGPRRAAWRFALCAAFPGLIVLSFATTARSIYAAPCMVGFALLVALWAADDLRPAAGGAVSAGARRAISMTAMLIALLALLVLAVTVALQYTVERERAPLFLLSAITAGAVAAWSLRLCLAPAKPVPTALLQLAVAWALLLSLGVLSLFSAMNRSQDIQSLAARVARAAGPHPVLLWSADETTLAWAQLYLPEGSWSALDAAQPEATTRLTERLRAAPQTVVVSMIVGPGWSRAAWLDYLRGSTALSAAAAVPAAPPATAAAADPVLAASGLVVVNRVERPGGRGYWIWARLRAPDRG